MNTYRVAGSTATTGTVSTDYLKAIALGIIFGHNHSWRPADPSAVGGNMDLYFDLPFSLSNLDGASGKDFEQIQYDSAFQSVNEYSDRPYPVKGLMCVIADTATNAQSDLDNFKKWTMTWDDAGTPTVYNIYVGIVNSTQTDFYTPLSNATIEGAVYYKLPSDTVLDAIAMIGHDPTVYHADKPSFVAPGSTPASTLPPLSKPSLF